MEFLVAAIVIGLIVSALLGYLAMWRERVVRERFIRAYMFPPGVFQKFHAARPGLEVKDQQLVARALRHFFLAWLKGGCRRVAMPTQVTDDLWHEFILFTRDYQRFCDKAFGQFLHHTPAVKLGRVKADNEGLRRVWWFSCLEENIDPRKATRLPLLFAIDRKLAIPGGFVYELDCRRAPRDVAQGAAGGTQCAEAFGDSSVDGSTDGLGCTSGDSGGCSGGCGGD